MYLIGWAEEAISFKIQEYIQKSGNYYSIDIPP